MTSLITFGGLIWLALKCDRWWLVFAAGCQLLALSTHIISLLQIDSLIWTAVTLRWISWGACLPAPFLASGKVTRLTSFDAVRGAPTTMPSRTERMVEPNWATIAEPIGSDDTDILSDAIGNRAIAEVWMSHFHNLAGIAATNRSVLYIIARQAVPDQAQSALARLQAIHRYGFRALAQRAVKRPLFVNHKHTEAFLRTTMQAEGIILSRVLFLDAKLNLILDEVVNRGSVNHFPIYPREVMRRALEVHAASLLIVHNHPWGDPIPMKIETNIVREIITAATALGIGLQDYLIVGRHGAMSFRETGLLDACAAAARRTYVRKSAKERRLREHALKSRLG